MKKLFMRIGVMFGVVLGLSCAAHAGTPVETYYMGQPNLANTTIQGSTASVTSATNLTVTIPATTSSGGSTSVSCRTCFTSWIVQIPTTTVFNVLDGGTTSYVLYGAGLGTTGTNTRTKDEDHLAPFCATAGNAVTMSLVNTGGLAGNPQVVNYEGFTNCGGTANKGPLQ